MSEKLKRMEKEAGADIEGLAFEDAMEGLEAISERLAAENIRLDEAIELYEQGATYYAVCRRKLENANQRIRVIDERLEEEK